MEGRLGAATRVDGDALSSVVSAPLPAPAARGESLRERLPWLPATLRTGGRGQDGARGRPAAPPPAAASTLFVPPGGGPGGEGTAAAPVSGSSGRRVPGLFLGDLTAASCLAGGRRRPLGVKP